MFKKIYEEEYGVFGGAPFAHDRRLPVQQPSGGYGPAGENVAVAAAAHAPFLRGIRRLFNLDSYTQLDEPRDLAKIFDSAQYAKWKSFRTRTTPVTWAFACPTC